MIVTTPPQDTQRPGPSFGVNGHRLDQRPLCALALLLAGLAQPAQANLSNLNIDGFGTVGLARTTNQPISESQAYLIESELDEKHLSRLALQLSWQPTEKLSFISQTLLSSYDNFGDPRYELSAEWAYLRYTHSDQLTVRVGRQQRPLFEYSDYRNLGYAYPWAIPPTSVYLATFRPFVEPVYSVDLYHTGQVAGLNLSTQAYLGFNPEKELSLFGDLAELEEHRLGGLVLTWHSRFGDFRVASHRTNYSMSGGTYTDLANAISAAGRPDLAQSLIINNDEVCFNSIGYSHQHNNWRWFAEFTTTDAGRNFLPNTQGWFAGTSYAKDRWTLSYTLGEVRWRYKPDLAASLAEAAANTAAQGQGSPQSLAAAGALGAVSQAIGATYPISTINQSIGLRYELSDSLSAKAEYEYLDGEGDSGHAHHYRLALDFIF